MALNKLKALKLIQFLDRSIKKPETSLKYRNHFTLLTSVVLSAQCTDTNVNNVTKYIYKNKIEHIELKHTAFSRELFADGALNAAIWISKKNKGLFNMQDMFNLK